MAEGREDAIENISSGDEVPGQTVRILCQPCSSNDTQRAADVYCSTCDEFQCKECSKVHGKYGLMKNHKLVSAKDAKSKVISFDMKGLDQCDQHHELLKFFCEDENQLCCSTCAIVDHRKCDSVVQVQKLAERAKSTDTEIKVKFWEIKSKAELVIGHTQSSKEQLDLDVKMVLLKLKKMRDDVNQMFDDLETSVSNKAESFETDTLDKLTRKRKSCENHLTEVTQSLATIENVHQNGTPSQQFIIEHKMKKRAEELRNSIENEYLNIETVTVSFDFNETLKLPPLQTSDYMPGTFTLQCAMPEALRMTEIASIDVETSTSDIGEPLYSGLDFLPDGRLIAVDNRNEKCVIFSLKLEKVGSYQLSYNPQSVVAVSDEEVAITRGYKKIDFLGVSRSNKITFIRTLVVTANCESICMKDDRNFVIGTVADTLHVRIVSLLGEEKDFCIDFPNKKYSVGTSACTYIRNRDTVVLADRNEHTVYIYDIAAKTRVVVKDDRIKTPFDVAVGPSNCILVCSMLTHSIVQVSPAGRILSSYKLDVKYPHRACVSNDKSILAVSAGPAGKMKLQLFKLMN